MRVAPTEVVVHGGGFSAGSSAGKMGATTYAVPAVVVLLSWIFLGEVPGLLTALGGVVCLAGVAVSRSRSRRAVTTGAAATEPSESPSLEPATEPSDR